MNLINSYVFFASCFDGEVDYLAAGKTKLYCDGSLISILKIVIYFLFFKSECGVIGGERGGHAYFYGSYIEKSPNAREINDVFLKEYIPEKTLICRVVDTFDLFGILGRISAAVEFYNLVHDKVEVGFLTKVIYSLCYGRYYRDHVDFLKLDVKCSTAGFFCDAIGFENILAQYYTRAGVLTYTQQHGQYRNLSKSNWSADVEAINNFVSSKMLCWGQATIDELVSAGVDKDRFLIVGKFSCANLIDNDEKNKSLGFCFRENFGLSLCGENSHSDNVKLIQFADRVAEYFDVLYFIRFHPSNNRDYYLRLSAKGRSCVGSKYYDECGYTILGMSSVYLEFIDNCHPFVFYDSGDLPQVFKRSGCAVNNLLDLLAKEGVEMSFPEMRKFYNSCEFRHESLIKIFGEDYVV